MQQVPYQCEKHIIVCVNKREEGDCCSNVGGEEIYRKIKDFIKQNGMAGRIWATRARCLGFCNDKGTTIVIYPDKFWFTEVTEQDLPKIYGYLGRGIE